MICRNGDPGFEYHCSMGGEFSKIRILASVLFLLAAVLRCPVAAGGEKGFAPNMIEGEAFNDDFQTTHHFEDFPAMLIAGNFAFTPWWRLELRDVRGTGGTVNGFKGSVGDFEGRVAHRLDDPAGNPSEDSPFKHFFGWLSWKIWTSTDYVNGQKFYERDEGLGLGVTRDPAFRKWSYWYTAGIYPSVHTSLAKQINTLSLEAGIAYRISPSVEIMPGYRYQAVFTDGSPHQRAQDQGFLIGIREYF